LKENNSMRRYVILNTEFYAKSSYSGKSKVQFPIDAFELDEVWSHSDASEIDFTIAFRFNSTSSEKKACPKPYVGDKRWFSYGYYASNLQEADKIFNFVLEDALICQLISIHKIPDHKYIFATNVHDKFATDLLIFKKSYLMPFVQKFGENELPKNW